MVMTAVLVALTVTFLVLGVGLLAVLRGIGKALREQNRVLVYQAERARDTQNLLAGVHQPGMFVADGPSLEHLLDG